MDPASSAELTWAEPAMRAGWIARGVSYTGAGLLAASLTVGFLDRSDEPTQRGALQLVGSLPLGQGLLVVLAAGLLLFAAWELTSVVLGQRNSVIDGLDHAGKLLGVGFYALLAWSAVESAVGAPSSSGSAVDRLSNTVMQYPLGRVAVAGAGLAVIAVAARRGRRSATADFGDSLEPQRLEPVHRRITFGLGRVGELGRAASLMLVGGFLVIAGWQDRAAEARGLDRSLYEASGHPAGRWAVLSIGIGFSAYGLFCIVSAPARRLPSDGLRPG